MGRASDGGGHRSIDSVHTQERRAGVLTAQVLLGAEIHFDQQTPLLRRPALSRRSRWHGRPRVEGRALPKLQEWKWNGTDGSASVCLGGVDAALGAIHVLFSGEKGWGRELLLLTRFPKQKTKTMQLRLQPPSPQTKKHNPGRTLVTKLVAVAQGGPRNMWR